MSNANVVGGPKPDGITLYFLCIAPTTHQVVVRIQQEARLDLAQRKQRWVFESTMAAGENLLRGNIPLDSA